MSGFRGVMASDLIVSGCDLSHDGQCAVALLGAGWTSIHVAAHLADAMSLARAMSEAQDRETIIRDMAQTGDAPPVATGLSYGALKPFDVSSSNLPGASASGSFGSLL
jgi:hypothetical protein